MARHQTVSQHDDRMLRLVLSVITRNKHSRSDVEIHILLPWLRNLSHILNSCTADVLVTLLKYCDYQVATRNDVIIRQGDYGDSFYVMLSGKTSVFIDTQAEDASILPTSKQTRTEALCTMNSDDEEETVGRESLGQHITTYEAGSSFGEIALLKKDALRNASIVADEDTDLLVIDRELFDQTLKGSQAKEFQEKVDFVESHPLFGKWQARSRRLLEMSLRKEFHPFDSTIIKQGDSVTGLHFIASGQAKILVEPRHHPSQYPKYFDGSDSILAQELGRKSVRKAKPLRESVQQEQVRVRRHHGYAAAERRLAQKAMTLCTVDTNEIIGDLELVLGLDTYAYTLVSTANAEVFVLDNKNLERLVQKKNTFTTEVLRDSVETKLQNRTALTSTEIPLFSKILNKLTDTRLRRLAALETPKKEEPEKEQTLTERIKDPDLMMSQLTKLFVQGKTPLVQPSVPGSVYFLTKTGERARREQREKRAAMETEAQGEMRLVRARRLIRRQARSRRELERVLSAGPSGAAQLKDKDSAINRFNNQQARRMTRPHTAYPTNGYSDVTADRCDHDPVDNVSTYAVDNDDATEPQYYLDSGAVQRQGVRNIVFEMADLGRAKNSERARTIKKLMHKHDSQRGDQALNLMRPKSAPALFRSTENGHTVAEQYHHDHEEDFDIETSDLSLRRLENKLRAFHESHEKTKQPSYPTSSQNPRQGEGDRQYDANSCLVTAMRRFNIQTPEDVPIPGGTVYVRQRQCRYPSGTKVNPALHQHVRRFMMPKDAYKLAARSLTATELDARKHSRTAPAKTKSVSMAVT